MWYCFFVLIFVLVLGVLCFIGVVAFFVEFSYKAPASDFVD